MGGRREGLLDARHWRNGGLPPFLSVRARLSGWGLHFYGINLHHLNPKSILQIAIFVYLYEGYYGIRPHFAFFFYLYHLNPQHGEKPHRGRGKRHPETAGPEGGGLCSPLRSSNNGWQSKWFYCSNPIPSLPPFTGHALVVRDCWSTLHAREEMVQICGLLKGLKHMIKCGLTGVRVAANFVAHQIQSLKSRSHPVWKYTGKNDETRERQENTDKEKAKEQLVLFFETRTVITTEGYPRALRYNPDRPKVIIAALRD